MKEQRRVLRFVVFAGILLFLGRPLRADITGTILGTVTDPSGAVIPGAHVTLRNGNTGLVRTATADTAGSYKFLEVPVGEDYAVEVTAGGFEKEVLSRITLLVNQAFRADFQLKVGATTQTVEVTAAPVQVETTSTQLGDVIEDRKMLALPLNGRSYLDLLGLQAGVAPQPSSIAFGGVISGGLGNGGTAGTGTVAVNGQRESTNAFVVNGGTVEHVFENGASVVPTLDSIQEFRLLTNSFNAEYGKFSGAVVNVLTKTGTNNFHGDAFEFLRNEKLDARNFFDRNNVNPLTGEEIPGTARGLFRRNQFGGTLGGRVIKDKLFFFGDYQGTRNIQGLSTGLIQVPSVAERGGDFSAASPFTGMVRGDNLPGHFAQTLSSRLGYTVSAGEPYFASGCNTLADSQAGTCVFYGNVIPQAAFSPAGGKLLQYIPAPGVVVGGIPYFTTSGQATRIRDDKFGQRWELNTQRLGAWTTYYSFDDATVNNPFAGGNVPGFAAKNLQRAQQVVLGNTRTFGPTAVNEVRLNWLRSAQTNGIAGGGRVQSITDLGFAEGGLGIIPAFQGVPGISLTLSGIGFGAVTGGTNTYQNTYQMADNYSRVMGKHTLKLGADFHRIQFNIRIPPTNGFFNFFGNETGKDFADLLIGAPDYFLQVSTENEDDRTYYLGLYAQDTWKYRSNLTLNYGLRWDVSEPYWDKGNKIQDFIPGKQSQVFTKAPEGLVFPNDPGVPKTLSPTRYHNFAPRVGLAYSPEFSDGLGGKLFGGPGKTSIRAAFGIFFAPFEEASFLYETGNAPFGNFFSSPSLVYLEEPFKTRTTGPDVGQRFPLLPPTRDVNFAPLQPVSFFTTVAPDNVVPYGEHFNLSLQRQIGNSTILTIAYVGSEGHHLLTQIEQNPGNAARCLQIPGCGPGGEDTIYNVNGQVFYGTRPHSVTSGRYLSQGILDFGSTVLHAATLANSSYNSLQITLNKVAGPLRLLAAYTYGKSLDNSSGFGEAVDPFNYNLSRSLSSFDLTHNFVVSYSYDLPFRRLFRSSGRAAKLTDGWSFSGITRFATGLPVSLFDTSDRSLVGTAGSSNNGIDLPDFMPVSGRTHPQTFDPRTANFRYFAKDQFTQQALGSVGTASRRFFHGPGINNFDFALHKTTQVSERLSLEARFELFNTFNHTQFNGPVGNIAASTFGLVTSARDPRIGQAALKLYF